MKFGGTSVGSAANIKKVLALVREAMPRGPVVVASAFRGVTDMLLDLGKRAVGEDVSLADLEKRHADVVRDLGVEPSIVAPEFDELRDLLRGIRLVKELTPRSLDYVGSFGERMSTKIIAAYFRASGTPAVALDAGAIGLVTDSRFTRARPLPEAYEEIPKARDWARSKEVPIVTGFVGRDRDGNVTTLGRNGSDYSASIVGAALRVEEIQIWTDVDGVMTADPRIVKGARFIPRMSFAEASELAFYGAKVLHPATMVPAVRKDIPIRVLNSYRPDFEGTTIVAHLEPGERGVKSIASKDRIVVVNIVAASMIFQYGFLERVASIFARAEIVVDMIATSEVSLAMTTDPAARLEPAVAELATFAEVTVQRDMSLVSVVGEELKERTDFSALIFDELAKLQVKIELISYGATRNNLAFVIAQDRVREVVSGLHRRLFGA